VRICILLLKTKGKWEACSEAMVEELSQSLNNDSSIKVATCRECGVEVLIKLTVCVVKQYASRARDKLNQLGI
jgi:hypothetical protein